MKEVGMHGEAMPETLLMSGVKTGWHKTEMVTGQKIPTSNLITLAEKGNNKKSCNRWNQRSCTE